MLIIFEGIVGSGKTTQSKKLAEYFKTKHPNKKVIWSREPGGSEIADSIRKIVQGTKFEEEMHPICEAYLYAASRAQTLNQLLSDNAQDSIIILDRSYITSLAYQGNARGLGIDDILEINRIAIRNCQPDIVIFLKNDVEKSLKRTYDADGDKFEAMDVKFFKSVEHGYAKASELPHLKDTWVNIEADGTIDEVFERVLSVINARAK